MHVISDFEPTLLDDDMCSSLKVAVRETDSQDNPVLGDPTETKFLDWHPLPKTIAVLPELTSPSTARLDTRRAVRSVAEDGGIAPRRDRHTLGGVQMDLTQALVRESQSLRYGDKKMANESLWRNAA